MSSCFFFLSFLNNTFSSVFTYGKSSYLVADIVIREEKDKDHIKNEPFSIDTEKKEEMTECLRQLSGYSSLLSTDSSPKAMIINSHDLTEISKVIKTGKCFIDFLSDVKRTSKH